MLAPECIIDEHSSARQGWASQLHQHLLKPCTREAQVLLSLTNSCTHPRLILRTILSLTSKGSYLSGVEEKRTNKGAGEENI